MVTLYHNPRCSKSRETLALLQGHGLQPHIIEYLKTPPSARELQRILKLLGLTARELVRRNEPEYRQCKLETATEMEIVLAMVEHPVLIQRPIVIAANKAALGRPPENVLEIL